MNDIKFQVINARRVLLLFLLSNTVSSIMYLPGGVTSLSRFAYYYNNTNLLISLTSVTIKNNLLDNIIKKNFSYVGHSRSSRTLCGYPRRRIPKES